MKSVIISAILIAVVITGGIVYMRVLENVSGELGDINSQITEQLKQEDFDGAEESVRKLEEYLDEKDSVLSAISNHQELDNIEMNLSELKRYTEECSKADALSKSEVLDFLFKHLPKNYRLKLENIL